MGEVRSAKVVSHFAQCYNRHTESLKIVMSQDCQLKYILFDLDDTLYPRSSGLMNVVGNRIRQFIMDTLALDAEGAAALQKRYYQVYGTTLRGLQTEHGIDPEIYLTYVHDIPLEEYLHPDPDLDRLLRGITLTKVIVTNGSAEHARRVLAHLGIAHHFETILDIRSFNYYCKPDPRAYQRILELLRAQPQECILVDDSPRNLLPAKSLGMTTVLMDGEAQEGVDYAVASLADLRQVLMPLGCFHENQG